MDKDTAAKPTILVLHETVIQSWVRDASAYTLTLTVIGTGWALDSTAMQWMGFLLLIVVAVKLAGVAASKRLTPQQAADYLRDKFGVTAGHRP